MANATDKASVFEQALTDAGFGDIRKEQCCRCFEDGNLKALDRLLQEQRAALLNKVHEGRKQIDCLDYLAYTLKKNS